MDTVHPALKDPGSTNIDDLAGRIPSPPRIGTTRHMMTPQMILGHVNADPFRPFLLHLTSGRVFEVRHPEMIKVLRSTVLIFKATGDSPDLPDEWESVSLMLTESVSRLELPVS